MRRVVSVGVIYLTVLNLPRHIRFKPENTIVVRVIPSLNKEPASLNTFLEPMVKIITTLIESLIRMFLSAKTRLFRLTKEMSFKE